MFLLRCFLPRKKATWLVQLAFLVLCFSLVGFTTPTYADVYTASLTTSGDITVDVNTNKGAALSTDEVTVNSTCPLGYTLTVAGPTDSNLYKGGDDTASSITASTGTPSSTKPIMGESESGGVTTSYLNTWGYSLDSNTTINSNTFIGLTSTPNTLINKATASSDGGDTLNIHYGVSVDSSKESGSYILSNNGTITYYLTTNPNCSSFKIVYNGNNDDGNTTMSVTHDNVIENDDINLYASNFIKAGYGFAGWSTEQLDPEDEDAADNLRTAVTAGHVYGPNETITADSTFLSQAKNINNINTITLYAIWIKPTATIQSWKGCGNMNQGDVIALTDQRDNQVYSVAKLADNNCWMIENLRLDNEYTVGQNQTDPSVTNESLSQGYATSATYGNFIGLANPETDHFGADTTANSIYYSGTKSGTATVNVGTTDYPENRIPRYSNVNTHNTVSDMTSSDQNIYSYGNYYNWPAAIADLEHYDENSQSVATTSICPAGWQLPIGRQTVVNTSFGALSVALGGPSDGSTAGEDTIPSGSEVSKSFRSYPNNYLFNGRYDHASSVGAGTYGYYWTPNVNDANYASAFYLNMTYAFPGTTSTAAKSYGRSIRCLALPTYTVQFDANGGTGTMDNQGVYVGETTTLSANAFTAPTNPTGLIFTGWNTAADGTGTHYDDEASIADLTTAGNRVTLYAQWGNCPSGRICYDTNASSGVEGTMGMQQVASTDTSITLLASNYSRTGYGFAGWNTEPDYTGTFYGPQEDMNFTAGTYTNKGLKLYAIWVESEGSMQDSSKRNAVCNRLTAATYDDEGDADESTWSIAANLNSVSALTDMRDGQTYAIAKLPDGNCWMIENLRLADTHQENSNTVATTLTTANTNNPSLPLTNIYDSSSTSNRLSPTTSVVYDASTAPQGWCTTFSASCFNQSRLRTDNTVSRASYNSNDIMSNDANLYSYGNYYNWYSATAGNGTYDKSSGNVPGDLCPAGWRLPTGTGTGEFGVLSNSLGGLQTSETAEQMSSSTTPTHITIEQRFRHFPNNLLFSGYVDGEYGATFFSRGRTGYYWSATASSNYYVYHLTFSPTNAYPGIYVNNKYNGRTIRCIASNA